MLYATTRNPRESFTAAWAIHEERAPDGGFYVPFRQPYFYQSHLRSYREMGFLRVEAEVLNQLFGSHLSQWDLMLGAGRAPLHLQRAGRRTLVGERWRNAGWNFETYASQVSALLSPGDPRPFGPWLQIGVSAALLFAAVAELQSTGILQPEDRLDVAADGENILPVLGCLYGKAWGLPIGHVVCGLRESSGVWELIHDCFLQTDVLEPDSQAVDNLEQILCCEAGQAEVRRFLNDVRRGRPYVPAEPLQKRLSRDLAVSNISRERIETTVPGVLSTGNYLLSRDAACGYAALLDFRSVSGSGNWGLVLADRSPSLDLEEITRASGLSREAVQNRMILI